MPPIRSFYHSDLGRKRENNEDAVGGRAPQDAREAQESGWLYVVADGLGGHSFGERASRQVVQTLLNGYYAAPHEPPPERLRRLIRQANAEIHQEAARTLQEGDRMATTVVAAVIRGGRLYLAHVGDSRAYLVRKNRIYLLTQDHSVVGEMMRAGALTEEQARTSKLRNRLTRSVGARPEVEVEISQPIPLQPGDLLLLCTDGLTQYATDRDLLAAARGEPQEIVERLIEFANARGGSDNITVAAILYGKTAPLPLSLPRPLAIALATSFLCMFLAAAAMLAGQAGMLNWLLPTATLTASPTPAIPATSAATPTSSPAVTDTPTPSETPTPSPSPALTDTPFASGTGVPALLPERVNCEYRVRPNEYALEIARRFGVPLEAISFADGSQRSLDLLYPDDRLLLRGVLPEACRAEGGQILPPTPTPALPPIPSETPRPSPSLSPTP